VLAHLAAHPPTAGLYAGLWLEAAGLAVLVLFAARLASRIGAARPGWWLPSTLVGLAVAAFAVKVGSFAPGLAALETEPFDAGTVTALLTVNDAAVEVTRALDGAFVLLLGLGAVAVGGLPRWLGGATVVTGAAQLASVAVPVFGVLSLLLFGWALVASGWLLTRGTRTSTTSPDPALAG
jgi:hypothetical protein